MQQAGFQLQLLFRHNQGHDIVAIAKTGSGKTLSCLIPGFIHLKLKRNSPRLGPTILVFTPTRELATQIQVEVEKFGRSSTILLVQYDFDNAFHSNLF
ncbi:hypothetical protein ACS0TY_026882 [Phlomoides rotata]